MSRIKDIMDVDVEPRRQHQLYTEVVAYLPSTSSPEADPSKLADDQERTNHHDHDPSISKPESTLETELPQLPPSASKTTRRPRPGGDPSQGSHMNVAMSIAGQDALSANTVTSRQMPLRSVMASAGIPIKYTPVTGRISKAKKGVPVHTCKICRPAKTFTRAEHLR